MSSKFGKIYNYEESGDAQKWRRNTLACADELSCRSRKVLEVLPTHTRTTDKQKSLHSPNADSRSYTMADPQCESLKTAREQNFVSPPISQVQGPRRHRPSRVSGLQNSAVRIRFEQQQIHSGQRWLGSRPSIHSSTLHCHLRCE